MITIQPCFMPTPRLSSASLTFPLISTFFSTTSGHLHVSMYHEMLTSDVSQIVLRLSCADTDSGTFQPSVLISLLLLLLFQHAFLFSTHRHAWFCDVMDVPRYTLFFSHAAGEYVMLKYVCFCSLNILRVFGNLLVSLGTCIATTYQLSRPWMT